MLPHPRTHLIALAGGLILSAARPSREPPAAASPAPAAPRRTDADGFPLPAGAIARFGSIRFRHRDLIQPVAFSPDGRSLYIGTADHEALYAWDAGTGRLRWRVTFEELKPTEPRPDRSLAPRDIGFIGREPAVVIPDQAGREYVIRFDPAGGKESGRVRLDPQPAVRDYRFSRDGSRVAVSYEHNLAVYDTKTGRRVFAKRGDYQISTREGMDFSPDGRTLAVGDEEGNVHLFRTDTGQPVRDIATGNEHSLIGVRFALGGKVLVVRPMTTHWLPVLLIDAATGAVRHRLTTPGDRWADWSSAPAPDGKVLYTARRVYPETGELGDYLIAWDVETGKELRRFPCAVPFHTAVSPDGRVLATADGHTVELLDAATGKPLPQSSDPVGGYDELRAAPGGGWVGLSDAGVDTYDATGRRAAQFTPPGTDATAWWGHLSPDGGRLVRVRNTLKAERVGPIEVWDTRAGKLLTSFGREGADHPLPRFDRDGYSVRGFSPDGRTVYTARGRTGETILAWDLGTGRPTALPKGWDPKHRGRVVFSPDGRWLATTREAKETGCELIEIPQEVVVVEAATGRAVAVARGVKPPRIAAVAFSPDGRRLAVAPSHETEIINQHPVVSDDLVYLFELPSGREVGRLRGPDGSIQRLAFSPDGRALATAGLGRIARVWELTTRRPRLSVPHARLPRVLAFSADGRVLAADGQDAPVYLWDVRGELDRPKNPPDAAGLAGAWDGLASEDAREAFVAVRLLAAFPDRAIPFLKQKPAPDGLRAVRAVEAVEWIGTPDAVKLLDRWAGGPADSALAAEAKAARARLGKR